MKGPLAIPGPRELAPVSGSWPLYLALGSGTWTLALEVGPCHSDFIWLLYWPLAFLPGPCIGPWPLHWPLGLVLAPALAAGACTGYCLGPLTLYSPWSLHLAPGPCTSHLYSTLAAVSGYRPKFSPKNLDQAQK